MATPTYQANTSTEQLRQSTCPYCGVGCGVDISCNVNGRVVSLDKICGTPEHPANHGRLCVKGTNLLETNSLGGRLLHPTIAGEKVEWDTATRLIADKITQTVAQYGADAVAFYVSGQLLTEDYYIANKLMKGFIGSANIATKSRLCMSSAVAAYKRAFGEDVVPCQYTDLESTELLVLTGSNTAWAHPVLFQRIQRAKLRNPNMKVVVLDPRKTETCTLADLHLPLKPGTDVAVFNGLLNFAHTNGSIDANRVHAFADGLDDAVAAANDMDIDSVSQYSDVNANDLHTFYRWFCDAERVITFYSMGINQSAFGVDKANAIINCHLALEQIGREGAGPFSITGQPNAMGGREVGGLANMLAAHRDIENPKHRDSVKSFWNAPHICEHQGLKAVDLFDAMASGKVKFVWIMGTNPVVSMPHREQVENALRRCETVVVSDIVNKNDTLDFAHIALPATGWSEKDGMVTNSERRMSRQRGILPPPKEARHDWQIMCDVAKKMGFEDAFDYSHPYQIFDEFARLTAYENDDEKLLNLAALVGMTQQEYDNFSPVQWPLERRSDGSVQTIRPFTSLTFPTDNGKAKCIAVTPQLPQQVTTASFPFVLNSGRARDHWHTMTRTGKAAKLHAHMPHASVSMHPMDAQALQLSSKAYVSLSSEVSGETPCIFPVSIDEGIRRGELFIPIHWSGVWGSHSKLAKLYAPATDAISGQPELKHAAVNLVPTSFKSFGQVCIREQDAQRLGDSWGDYWAKTQTAHGVSWSVASHLDISQWLSHLLTRLPKDWVIYQHKNTSGVCLVGVHNDTVCAFVSLGQVCPSQSPDWLLPMGWIDSLLNSALTNDTLSNLLHGRVDDAFTKGAQVCSCFNVREKTISEAIEAGCQTVDELGERLKCGTNCGSCKPRLSEMLNAFASLEIPSVETA